MSQPDGSKRNQDMRQTLEAANVALMNGELDDARQQINALRAQSELLRDTDATLEVAELCLLTGMVDEAEALVTAALQQRGDHVAFHEFRERLRAILDESADAADESPVLDREPVSGIEALLGAERADIARFLHLFAGREDHHARQWVDPAGEGRGGYSPLRSPLTPEVITAHLNGSVTLGVYLLRLDQTAMFFCLDIDIRRKALQAATTQAQLQDLRELVHDATLDMQARLQRAGLSLLMEDSGHKGRHLWGFLREPVPGAMLHRFGRTVRAYVGALDPRLSLEFFPKQESVAAGGLGNLVKLPLGVHLVSGRRSTLMVDGRAVENPWPLLHGVKRLSRAELMDAQLRIRRTTGSHTHAIALDMPSSPATPTVDVVAPRGRGGSAGPVQALSVEQIRRSPGMAKLLQGCPVLADLVQRAEVERRLSHHERVVIVHALGHVVGGVETVNAVLGLCPDTPPEDRLKRILRGHPISCGRIRERIPELTSRLPCACEFSPSDVLYPTPSRHLMGQPLFTDAWARQERGLGEREGGVAEVREESSPIPPFSTTGRPEASALDAGTSSRPGERHRPGPPDTLDSPFEDTIEAMPPQAMPATSAPLRRVADEGRDS